MKYNDKTLNIRKKLNNKLDKEIYEWFLFRQRYNHFKNDETYEDVRKDYIRKVMRNEGKFWYRQHKDRGWNNDIKNQYLFSVKDEDIDDIYDSE